MRRCPSKRYRDASESRNPAGSVVTPVAGSVVFALLSRPDRAEAVGFGSGLVRAAGAERNRTGALAFEGMGRGYRKRFRRHTGKEGVWC
ncbi:MAG: hypothetical protein HQL99_09430 [Magnetococcales bacterium]|nr:hypothetical protein [Magnetococcales bacterium]